MWRDKKEWNLVLDFSMLFVPLYIDGAEGAGGAKILALATADALLVVDNGYHGQVVQRAPVQLVALAVIPLPVFGILLDTVINWHHLNGSCRTLGCTTATLLVL